MADPGKVVSGLTREQVEADPKIAEFLRANFGSDKKGEGASGITIPDSILEEFGIREEDLFAEADGRGSKPYGTPRVDAGLGTPEQQRLNIRVLKSFVRTAEGSRSSQRLREDDSMVPGILYGSDPTTGTLSLHASSKTLLQTPWPELQRELDRYHRRFESRVYDLTVYEGDSDTEGSVHRVLPRNVQRHPVQGKIYCANFLRYHPRRPIKVPLIYINREESPALKRDGYIIPVNKHVECFVEDGVPIPDALEVECTGLLIKDVVRLDRVIFPDGVRMTDRVDVENFVVGPVRGGRDASMAGDAEEGESSK
jgi:ribosomal protein L25 (general stress protein Ctc)